MEEGGEGQESDCSIDLKKNEKGYNGHYWKWRGRDKKLGELLIV